MPESGAIPKAPKSVPKSKRRLPNKIQILPKAFYSRQELERAGICSPLTALRAEQSGRLKAHRAATKVLYCGSDIIEWLSGGTRERQQ